LADSIEPMIIRPEKNVIDYKEALIFAFLGLLRLKGINNVLATVTGAPQDHCAGKVWMPK
jgi:anhydro-N-acetylmuramic acid kinase